MKLERIPKYRIPLNEGFALTVERDEEGWHLVGDGDVLSAEACIYIPHAAVRLLVEALTTDLSPQIDLRAVTRSKVEDTFGSILPAPVKSTDLGTSQGTSFHKTLSSFCGVPDGSFAKHVSGHWTYSPYRATLYRDGERFAMVTPDGSNALSTEAAAELLVALNGPDPAFDKAVDSPDIAPDPGYRMVEVGEIKQKGDVWKYASGGSLDVFLTVGCPYEPSGGRILQRRDPDAVAVGFNPKELTNEEVGIYDGWRLLTEAEHEEFSGKQVRPTSYWSATFGGWNDGCDAWWAGGDKSTLRTKAEKLEVAP